LDLDTKKEV